MGYFRETEFTFGSLKKPLKFDASHTNIFNHRIWQVKKHYQLSEKCEVLFEDRMVKMDEYGEFYILDEDGHEVPRANAKFIFFVYYAHEEADLPSSILIVNQVAEEA